MDVQLGDLVQTFRPEGRNEVVSYVTQPQIPRELGWQFLQHEPMLTDILVELILGLRKAADAPIANLPFRWFGEPEEQLSFSLYNTEAGLMAPAALKPDAIVEAPGLPRRFFIEAETGTHSITTASPLNYGVVPKKLQRYAAYFTGFVEKRSDATWYSRAFPDGMFPELVFVVHAIGRRDRVEGAIKNHLGDARAMTPFAVRVVTFEEAPDVLGAVLRGAPVPRSRILTIDEQKALRIRDGYNALVSALNASVKALEEQQASSAAADPAAGGAPRYGHRDGRAHQVRAARRGSGAGEMGVESRRTAHTDGRDRTCHVARGPTMESLARLP